MSLKVRFALLPIDSLKPHERVSRELVSALASVIRARGLVEEPIWVAREHYVILNGHHRHAALVRLGAVRVPAWIVQYMDPAMELTRWSDGPPLEKTEILRRAHDGPLFPPKTSRHVWRGPSPARRVVSLASLGSRPNRPPAARRERPQPEASRFSRGRVGASGTR